MSMHSDSDIAQHLAGLSERKRLKTISAILADASSSGFRGFSGRCGAAAIVINRVLFDDAGVLVGAPNAPLAEQHDYLIGHVVVEDEKGWYWDSDAHAKGSEDIEHWGMLDPDDLDWADVAEGFGLAWNEDTAFDAAIFELSEDQIRRAFRTDEVDELADILREAARRHIAAVPQRFPARRGR